MTVLYERNPLREIERVRSTYARGTLSVILFVGFPGSSDSTTHRVYRAEKGGEKLPIKIRLEI